MLQRFIHTKLLTNITASDDDSTPAQRKRNLIGRVEEVAGQVKVGKGEVLTRTSEQNRFSKPIRDGIREKRAKISAARLAEVIFQFLISHCCSYTSQSKELGNYHPILWKNFEDDLGEVKRYKKRERGLGLGVGRFDKGTLHLSRRDIEIINRSSVKRTLKRKPTSTWDLIPSILLSCINWLHLSLFTIY